MPAMDHVFVVVMENHAYSSIIGSSSAPYINSLVASGGLATNYYAVAHPSLPNYLALVGGSTFGITSDCTTCWISSPSIADNLESAGRSWKAYVESMPSACYVGDSSPYAQKHNPFVYFNSIRTNATRCKAHDVPYTQLAVDLQSASTTPNYAFITPNMCNDMHDCSVATGDAWLKQQVPLILKSPAFTTQRSLLAITWDEDDSSSANHVPLIFVGPGVRAGATTSLGYNHYSLLHTFEAALGLPALTSVDAGAPPVSDLVASSTAPAPPPTACRGAGLTVTPATPGGTGIAVTMGGSTSGCANPRYRFWVRDPGSRWSMVQNYGAATSHVWAQTGLAGSYALEVDVRDASSTAAYDAVANLTYQVNGCSADALSTNPAGTQPRGTTITLVGSATCPGTPTYRFWVRAPGGAWRIARDYSTSSTFGWSPAIAGSYSLELDVRDQNASAVYEKVTNISYSIS